MVADRVRLRVALAASVAAAMAALTSACSVSVPLPAFVDRAPTGSVTGQPVALWSALDPEDMRRAKAAMAVALDPQGNGEAVAWENPKSGRRGSFAAAAAPYPPQHHICRSFTARLTGRARADQRIEGAAGRGRDGDWVVAELARRR